MLRKVRWWVLYYPGTQTLMRQPFRTKKLALAVQRSSPTFANCVVFRVDGMYVRPALRRGPGHD